MRHRAFQDRLAKRARRAGLVTDVDLFARLEALRHLSIIDEAVETARFEELLTRPELHEANDVLTVRAVRVETRTLLSLQAFLRPGGCLFWFRRQSRTDAPKDVPYPLEWARTVPLVEELGSRLVLLSKSQR